MDGLDCSLDWSLPQAESTRCEIEIDLPQDMETGVDIPLLDPLLFDSDILSLDKTFVLYFITEITLDFNCFSYALTFTWKHAAPIERRE